MTHERRTRKALARAEQRIEDLDLQIGSLHGRADSIETALTTSGVEPMAEFLPATLRLKTLAELATEYTNPLTTDTRRLAILASRCGLLPPETVAVPVVVGP